MVIYRRKIKGKVFDFYDGFRTIPEAEIERKKLLKKGWFTTAVITRSTVSSEKKPFRLWVRNEPEVLWNKYKASGVMKHIDKDIRALVRELNDNNIYTVESCSGHGKEPGQLWIRKENFSATVFKRIMKKHGMKNIRRGTQPFDANRDNLYFNFDLPTKVIPRGTRK